LVLTRVRNLRGRGKENGVSVPIPCQRRKGGCIIKSQERKKATRGEKNGDRHPVHSGARENKRRSQPLEGGKNAICAKEGEGSGGGKWIRKKSE